MFIEKDFKRLGSRIKTQFLFFNFKSTISIILPIFVHKGEKGEGNIWYR